MIDYHRKSIKKGKKKLTLSSNIITLDVPGLYGIKS
jgi:hypothetical protein